MEKLTLEQVIACSEEHTSEFVQKRLEAFGIVEGKKITERGKKYVEINDGKVWFNSRVICLLDTSWGYAHLNRNNFAPLVDLPANYPDYAWTAKQIEDYNRNKPKKIRKLR